MSPEELSAYIDNKEIVSELIQEYYRRPQLWHGQISSKFNTSQQNDMFQSITDALNAKLNLKLEVDLIKVLLYFICKQYFEEKKRQLSAKDETSANNSNLWFYEKMRFLQNQSCLEFELVVFKNMDESFSTENIKLEALEEKEEEHKKQKYENMSPEELSAYIDNKEIVSELIQEYHRRPQLWHGQISSKFNTSQQNDMLQSITDALNAKLNLKLEVDRIKVLLYFICKQYFEEKKRQLNAKDETSANNSNLWFYEKMRFLQNQTQSCLEFELVVFKNMIQLDESILGDLIDIYKTFEDFWKMRCIGTLKSYSMQLMCNEINDKLKISLCTFSLENIIFDIHTKYSRDKGNRFTCEMNQTEFKPLFPHFHKCDFLEDYQGPFRCPTCKLIIETNHQFQVHTSRHDGKVPFICDICGKSCYNEKTLNYHSYSHNIKNNNCTSCGKRYRAPVILKSLIQKSLQDISKCKLCNKVCNNFKSFHLHVSLDENKNCNICEKALNRQRELKLPKSFIHDKNELQCGICGKFLKKHLYRYHSFRHNGFRCYLCKRKFSNAFYLYNHLQKHDDKKDECHYCGKRYPSKTSLTSHKRRCRFRD